MSQLAETYERSAREVTQTDLERRISRDLLPNGAYAPIPGIYDLGWKAWVDMPNADFIRDLRAHDDTIIRENSEWARNLGPILEKGELTKEQVRLVELERFLTVDDFAIGIARHVFENLRDREVRDIILRHAAEETGHAELLADFLVQAFGMKRTRVWNGKPLVSRVDLDSGTRALTELRKESPGLAYATIPFLERVLPQAAAAMAKGLRKNYHFKANVLGFYDLHTYVDIYHERLGLYLLGKYANKKRAQELFTDAVDQGRRQTIKKWQAVYDTVLGK